MAQIKSIGRFFVVYGRDDLMAFRSFGWWSVTYPPALVRKERVVEGVDNWMEEENHRDGEGVLARFGGWCFGVGAFDKGLSPEMLDWIENKAVWLDDVEPGRIGRWKGKAGPGAETLGFDYRVHREADEGTEETAGNEHGAAQAAG